MELAHTKSCEEVLDYFNTDKERGLALDQVRKYQEKYGPNGMFPFFIYMIHPSYLINFF